MCFVKLCFLTHSKRLFEFELAKLLGLCAFKRKRLFLKINQDHPRTNTPLMLLSPSEPSQSMAPDQVASLGSLIREVPGKESHSAPHRVKRQMSGIYQKYFSQKTQEKCEKEGAHPNIL